MKPPSQPPRTPRQARSRETVRAVVEATRRVLARNGVEGLTPTEVARVAGVSPGTLYTYFRSKRDLLAAVEEESWADQVRVVADQLATIRGLPVEAAIFRIVVGVLDAMLQRAEVHGITPEETPAMTEHRRGITEEIVQRLLVAIERHDENHRLRPTDVRLALDLVARLVPFMAWMGRRDLREHVDAGRVQRELATMVVLYLVRDPDLAALDA